MLSTQHHRPTTASLTSVRDAVEGFLGDAELLPEGWHVRDVRRTGASSVVLDIGPETDRGVLIEWHERGDAPIPAFLEGPRYAVAYRSGPNAWSLDDPETPAPLKSAVARACELLALPPIDVDLSDRRDASGAGHREMAFTPDRFRGWLNGLLPVGAELASGWHLDRVLPFEPGAMGLLLRSASEPSLPAVQLDVRPTAANQPAAGRTHSLDVFYRTPHGHRADGSREALHAQLAHALTLVLEAGEDGLRWVAAPGARALTPAGRRSAVTIRCHETPRGGGEPRIADAIRDEMARAIVAGATALRLVGGDPLAHPSIRELLEDIRDGGVDALHVRTPATDLADPKVAPQVLDALPGDACVEIPLHSADATRHDTAAGVPGNFDRIPAALAVLKPQLLGRPGVSVALVTPITVKNVEELPAIARVARDLGVSWWVQLPDSPPLASIQRYREEAVSMTDAVVAVYPQDGWARASLPLSELRPCVAIRHQARSGHPLWTPAIEQERGRALAEPARLDNGGPRRDCPAREQCAVAHACEGWVTEAYADEIGLQELQPITDEDLSTVHGPASAR